MVARLQAKASQIGNILQTLEKKYENKGEHHQSMSNGHSNNNHYSSDKASVQSSSLSSAGNSLSRRQLNLLKFEQLTQKHKQQLLNSSTTATANAPTSTSGMKQRLHIKIDAIPPFNPNGSYKNCTTSKLADEGTQNELYLVGDRISAANDGFGANDHDLQTPLSAKSLKLNYDSNEIEQQLDATKSLQQMPSF